MVVVTINILVKPQLSRGVHPLVARLVLLLPEGPVESEEAKRTTIKSKITLIKCLLCLKSIELYYSLDAVGSSKNYKGLFFISKLKKILKNVIF